MSVGNVLGTKILADEIFRTLSIDIQIAFGSSKIAKGWFNNSDQPSINSNGEN